MLETKTARSLVSGSDSSQKGKTVKVKALRGFVVNGEPFAVGEIVEVDEALARSLAGSNKAEAVSEAEKPAKKSRK